MLASNTSFWEKKVSSCHDVVSPHFVIGGRNSNQSTRVVPLDELGGGFCCCNVLSFLRSSIPSYPKCSGGVTCCVVLFLLHNELILVS